MSDPALLERRLERFRASRSAAITGVGTSPAPGTPLPSRPPPRRRGLLGERLAERLGAELIRTGEIAIVRLDTGSQRLPVDRDRLARLPGQPPPDVPLVCLDTETTGLGTATGTVAFLVGLGWWEDDRFRQAQLILPDQADEPGLLTAITAIIPPGAWLVTYNGRSFDWPLLETRYRLRRLAPPPLAGHLDLLPVARRLFRHRLPDTRLRTVERDVLGIVRHGDVDGALIPGRYLEALRLGDPAGLLDVVRHNDLDVLALARLLSHLDASLAEASAWPAVPPGDLAGLGRAYRRAGRFDEALACLDAAIGAPARSRPEPAGIAARGRSHGGGDDRRDRFAELGDPDAESAGEPPWWSPRARPDLGGRPSRPLRDPSLAAGWTDERLLVERARLLRRLGRTAEAAESWAALAAGSSRLAAVAAIELAKLHEHRHRDPRAAMASVHVALRILERRRRLGRPEPALEADLVRRGARIRRGLGSPAA